MNEQKTILGPPGCGKTQTNSNLIHKYIKQGIDPDKIACVSFTKKAATESRERVCKNWNLTEEDLPYFQTLHSMAFQVLGHKPTEVMQSSDIRKIGYEVGLDFNSSTSDVENDFDFIGYKKGDAYLHLSSEDEIVKGIQLVAFLHYYKMPPIEIKRKKFRII